MIALSAPVALAQTVPDKKRVHIGLRGQISAKCGLSEIDKALRLDMGGDTDREQLASLDFTINCNTPFIYGLTSENGALRYEGTRKARGGAEVRLPYLIKLTIPTDDGGLLSNTCDSEKLAGPMATATACQADSGQSIAMNQKGRMELRWGPFASAPLAGNYSDNLNIAVNAKN